MLHRPGYRDPGAQRKPPQLPVAYDLKESRVKLWGSDGHGHRSPEDGQGYARTMHWMATKVPGSWALRALGLLTFRLSAQGWGSCVGTMPLLAPDTLFLALCRVLAGWGPAARTAHQGERPMHGR